MSQLIDKLKQVSKAAPQPMGFRTAQPASSKLQMLLIASLSQTETVDSLADYVAGADAVLLNMPKASREHKSLERIVQSLPDIPWGVRLEEIGENRIGTVIDAGGDFVVFSAASSVLAVPQDDKVGKILQVESSLSEGLLKTVNELPVDAVFAGNEQKNHLTWHHLMNIQRLADSLAKPMLVSIPSKVNTYELKTIWEAGADGVIAEVSTGQPVGRVKELRQAIDNLASLPPRKRGKAEAVIPHIGGETDTVADTEEEEEE